ncbi:MAG: type II secretion system protein, partial [Clostridia bacterium]|nr:type II secretion system protein [Clostridia bacterium]
MPKMKHGKQAFTLIELLVVICIIAILAAMLLPALQSARDSASTATCVNNLMQFSKAYQMYATTYDDFVPAKTAPFYSGGGSGCKWEDALVDVMGQAGSSSFRQSFFCEADASLDDSAATGSKKSYSLNNLSDAVHPYIPYTLDTSGKLKDLTGKYKGFISGNRTTSVHTASDLIVIGENCSKNNTIGAAAYSVSDVNACTGTSSSIQQAVAIYQRLTTHKTGGHLFLDGHAQHVKP